MVIDNKMRPDDNQEQCRLDDWMTPALIQNN